MFSLSERRFPSPLFSFFFSPLCALARVLRLRRHMLLLSSLIRCMVGVRVYPSQTVLAVGLVLHGVCPALASPVAHRSHRPLAVPSISPPPPRELTGVFNFFFSCWPISRISSLRAFLKY